MPWTMAAVAALAAGLLTGVVSAHPGALTAAMTRVSHTGRPRTGRASPRATPTPTPVPTAAPSPPSGSTSTMVNVEVGGTTRTYQLIRPVAQGAARLPAIVVLHGVNASIDYEEQRDQLLPLAASGQVILAYPVGYQESWNAGACCSPATDANVDDVAFITGVIQQLGSDPGVDASRITLMGFSNGGRMAYQVDCAQPGLVSSVVVVLAAPVTPCGTTTPVSLLDIATVDDPEVPYASGTGGSLGLTPVQDVVAAWRSRDGCASAPTSQTTTGDLTAIVWSSCRWGSQVQFATYSNGGHNWPVVPGSTPSPMHLIWAFAIGGGGPPP